MTSIGGLASCQTLTCNTLIADEIDTINTSKTINMTKDGTIRWSLGLDENNNFVIQNEVAEVGASIIANNDTGHVQILGGGGGGVEFLVDLTDVDTSDISNNDLMYYDSTDSKFKFSDTISVNAITFPTNIDINSANDGYISIGGSSPSTSPSIYSIAIGSGAGFSNLGQNAIAIGKYAAVFGASNDSIAMGNNAGNTNLGQNSIAIGQNAAQGYNGFPIKNNSIMLNATGTSLEFTTSNQFVVAPIRENTDYGSNILTYNTTTKEIQSANNLSCNSLSCANIDILGMAEINNLIVNADLSVWGDISCQDISVNGMAEINNLIVNTNLSVMGDITCHDKLIVNGMAEINNLIVNADLSVMGDISCQDISVNGMAEINNLTIGTPLHISLQGTTEIRCSDTASNYGSIEVSPFSADLSLKNSSHNNISFVNCSSDKVTIYNNTRVDISAPQIRIADKVIIDRNSTDGITIQAIIAPIGTGCITIDPSQVDIGWKNAAGYTSGVFCTNGHTGIIGTVGVTTLNALDISCQDISATVIRSTDAILNTIIADETISTQINCNSLDAIGDITCANMTGTLLTPAQTNITSVGILNSVDIDGGSIDNTIIGANTAAAGSFTSISTGSITSGSITSTGSITGGSITSTGNLAVSGNITSGANGLMTSQILSVGTSWVNIPLTAKRGAFLILASSIGNDDSCLVAAATDDSNYDIGVVNVISVSRDYATYNQLQMQWATNNYLQIRMSAGNTRNVSIMVIRA